MKKTLVIITLLQLISTTIYARNDRGDRDRRRHPRQPRHTRHTDRRVESNVDAKRFCENKVWHDEERPCRRFIRGRNFQKSALRVCSTLDFTSSRMDCLKTIANKRYRRDDLELCRDEFMDSDIVECLEDYGDHGNRRRVVNTRTVRTRTVGHSCRTIHENAHSYWSREVSDLKRRGETNAAIGAIGLVVGAVLNGSNDRTTRDIGRGIMVGSGVLGAYGLVQMHSASVRLPHYHTECSQYETRTSYRMIERNRCNVTRYTYNDDFGTYFYSEANCGSETYVTFNEDF